MKTILLSSLSLIILACSALHATTDIESSVNQLAQEIQTLNKKNRATIIKLVQEIEETLAQINLKTDSTLLAIIQNTWKTALTHSKEQLTPVKIQRRLNEPSDTLKLAQKKLAKTLSPKGQLYTSAAQITSQITGIGDKTTNKKTINQQLALIEQLEKIIILGTKQNNPQDFYKQLHDLLTKPKDTK